jgi:hypothetical protein
VTLMSWDELFYSHKKMRRLVNLQTKQFDYMLSWLFVSADKISVTETFCAPRCPKTLLKLVALISDRKVHMSASRPVVSKINPAHTKHTLLQRTVSI